MNPFENSLEAEEWLVEYWSPTFKTWKTSIFLLGPHPYRTFEDAARYLKSLGINNFNNFPYRIINVNTGDIIPEALL